MKAVKSLGNVAGFAVSVCGTAAVNGEPVGFDLDLDEHTAVIAGQTDDERVLHAFEAGLRARDVFANGNISAPFDLRQNGLPLVEGDDSPTADERFPEDA